MIAQLLALSLIGTVTQSTQIFSGTYFIPMNNIIPYESTIPLIYKINYDMEMKDLNQTSTIHNCSKEMNKFDITLCNIKNNFQILHKKIIQQTLIEQASITENDERRKRRGLAFLGDFFTWCCDIANTNQLADIIDNEQGLVDHTNQVIDSVKSEHQDLIHVNDNLNNLTFNMKNFTNKVQLDIISLKEQMYHLFNEPNTNYINDIYLTIQQASLQLYLNFYLDNMQEIKTKCYDNKLPITLIQRTILQDDIEKIGQKTKHRNLAIAIDPKTSLHLYYKLPLTTCKISDKTIIIKLQIPLRTANTNYKIFKNIPTPLEWDNQICYLTNQQYLLLQETDVTFAVHLDQENCNSDTYPLCQLPRNRAPNDQITTCLTNILANADLTTLRETCHYECTPKSQHTIITRILPTKFLLTNMQQDLQIRCTDEDGTTSHQTLPNNKTGTTEIILPCNCQLLENNTILIHSTSPCDKKAEDIHQYTHLIPITWTKFKTITIFKLETGVQHQFKDITEVIDEKWNLTTPTYHIKTKFTGQELEHIKLRHQLPEIINNTQIIIYVFTAWTAILTILLAITIYCTHVLFIKLAAQTPTPRTRDYPTPRDNHQPN